MKLWVVLLGFLVGGSVTLGHAPLDEESDSSVPHRKAFNKENGPNRHTRMGRQNEVSQILQPMKYSEIIAPQILHMPVIAPQIIHMPVIAPQIDDSNSTTDSPDDSKSTTDSPYDNTTSDVYDTTRDTFDNTRGKSTDSATRVLFGTSTEVDDGTTMARGFTIPVSDVTTETLNGLTGLEADSVDVEEIEGKFMNSTSHVTKSSRLTDEFQRIDDRLRTESSVMSVEMPQQTADENTAASKNSFNHVSTWNLTSLHPLFLQSTWRPQTSPPTTMPIPTKERDMGETRSWAALDEGLYVKTTTRRPFTPPTSTSVSWPFFDVEGESKRPLENSAETTELHVISPAGNDPGWGQHDDNLYVETATGKPLTHPVTTTTNTPDEVGSWIELEDGLYIRTSTRQPFTRPVKTRDPSTTVSDSVIPMSILTTTTATIPVTAADTVKPNATNEEPTSMENLWEKVSQWFMFEKIPNITSTKWTFSQNSAPVNLPSLPPSDKDTNTSGSLSGGTDSLFQPIASGSTEHLASSFPISDQGTLDRIMQLTNILNKNFSDGGQSPVLSTSHHKPMSPETSKNTPIPITFHKQKTTHKPPPFHAPTPPSRPIITNQPMMSDSPVTSPPWALPHNLLNMKTTETKFQWPSTTTSDIIGQTPSNLSTDTGQSTPETESLLPVDETQVQKPNLSLILQYFDKPVPTERTKISSSSPVTKNRISTTPPWENPSHPLYIRTTTRRPFRPLTAEIASTTIPGVDKRITNYGGVGNIVSQNSNALPAEQIPGAVTISSESSMDSINPNPFATTQSSAMNSEFNNTAAYIPAAFTTVATDSSFKDSYSNPYFDIPFIKPSLRRQPSHILAAPTNSPATVLVPLTPFGHLVSTTADDGTRDKPSGSMVSYLNSDLPLKMKITPLPGKPQGMREEATEPPRALPTRQLTQSASKQESPIILYDYYKKNTSPYTGVKHIPLNVNNDSTQVSKDANILSVTPAFNSPISEPQSNKKASGSSVQQMTDKLQERTSPQPPINWSLFPTREAQMTTVPPPESSTQGFMDSWSSKSWYSDLLKEKRTPTSDILSRESTDSLTDNLNNVHTTQKTSTVEPLNVTASVLSSSDSVDLYGIVNEVLSSYSIKTHNVPSFQDNSTKKAIYTQNDHPSINKSNKKGISSFGSNKYGSQLKSPAVDDFQSAFTSRPPQYWYLHKPPSSGFTTPFPRNPYKQVTKPNSNHLPPTFYDNTHDHFPWRDPRPPSSAQELLMTFQDNEPYWTENNVHADHRLPFWNHSYSSIVPTETVTSQPVSEEPSESLKETMIPAEEEYHGSENMQVTAAQIERLENMLFDAAKKVLPKNSTDLDILGYLIDLVKKSPVKNKPGEITIPVIPETAGISIRPQHMGTDPLHLVFQGESTSDPQTESISVSSSVTSATVHTTANFHEQDPQDLSFTISPQSVQLHIVPDAMVTFVPPLELKDTLITKLDTFPTVLHQTAPDFPTSRPPALSSIHPSLVPERPQPAFTNLYVSGSYQYDDTYADVQDDDYAYLDFFSSLETWYPALSSTSVSFTTFGINPGITLFTTYLYPQSEDVSYSKYPLNDESMFSFVSNGIQNPTFVHLRTKYPGEVLTPTFHSQLLSLEQEKSNLNVGIRPTFTTYMNVHSQNQANFHLYPGQDDLGTVNDKPNQSLQSLPAHTNVYTFSAQTSANKQPGKTNMNIKPSVSAVSLRPGAFPVQNINYISTYSGTRPDHVSIDIRPNEANINIKPDHNIPNIASYYPGTQATYTNINMHTAQPNVNIHPSKPLDQGTTDMKSSQFSTDTHPNQAGFDTLPDETSNYVPGHTGITTWASQVSQSIQPGQTNIFMHPSIFGITMQPGETDYNLQPGQASISILPDQVSVIVRPDQAGFIVRPDEVNIYVRPEEAGINITPDDTGINIRPDQAGIKYT
nr:mucin-3A-like [Penaeus vannamei]